MEAKTKKGGKRRTHWSTTKTYGTKFADLQVLTHCCKFLWDQHNKHGEDIWMQESYQLVSLQPTVCSAHRFFPGKTFCFCSWWVVRNCQDVKNRSSKEQIAAALDACRDAELSKAVDSGLAMKLVTTRQMN